MGSMTERHLSDQIKKGAWSERYVDRFYLSRPGWVDGTTLFHTLCKRYVRKGARVCELGPGASNSTTRFLSIPITVSVDDDKEEINRKSGLAYAAGFSLFAAVLAGLIAGWLLDRWLGTSPWLLITGIILGAAAGFYELIRSASKISQG